MRHSKKASNCYTSLDQSRSLFDSGFPILTYHKLGPHPWRVRLKGLYVSTRLFDRQLAELHSAGFATANLLPCNEAHLPKPKQIALTFDDGYRNVWQYGLEPLRKYGFHAIQYLVSDRIGQTNDWDVRVGEASEPLMNEFEIREWLAAGHEIGSHTLTHPYLTQLPPDMARAEIRDSKKRLEDTFGVAIRHFCYPYGDWNLAVRDIAIEAGYATAVTTDFGVNTTSNSPFELKRVTARYPSRSWPSLFGALQSLFKTRRGKELD